MEAERQTSNRLRQVRVLLWLLVALAVIGAAALFLIPRGTQGPRPATLTATLGGPFTLVDGGGQPFESSRLEGRPYAIFFGFTNCPDVCPTTLARLAKLRRSAGGEKAFDIVFVSIDPERDTSAAMDRYAKMFGAPIIALTGSPQQIDAVKKSYGIYAEKAPLAEAGHAGHEGDGYTMNHTSGVLLFDRGGKLAGMISATDSDEAAIGKLKAIAA